MTYSQIWSPWFERLRPTPLARLRLFCFPYAGGGAQIFRQWQPHLPRSVEVCAVQPPGRGGRMREPPHTNLLNLVEDVAAAIRPYLDRPWAVFGHSLGAIEGFELTRLLRREQGIEPLRLFVSGACAPHLPNFDAVRYNLSDQALKEELGRLNGTPKEVLESPEMMALMLPLIRADFEVIETYAYADGPPLGCPIVAFGGAHDPETTCECIEAWRSYTTGPFTPHMFDADHFFIHQAQLLLLRAVAAELIAAGFE